MEYKVGEVVSKPTDNFYKEKSIWNGSQLLPVTALDNFNIIGEAPSEIDPFKENIDPWTMWLNSPGYPEIKVFTANLRYYSCGPSSVGYVHTHPKLGTIIVRTKNKMSFNEFIKFRETHNKLFILDKIGASFPDSPTIFNKVVLLF